MSGEVNYRNFAGTPGKNPKYLSDSLAPWYGNWSPNIPGELSIDYTGLPTGECLARLIQTGFIGNRHLMFEFSQPQNIFGLTFETAASLHHLMCAQHVHAQNASDEGFPILLEQTAKTMSFYLALAAYLEKYS